MKTIYIILILKDKPVKIVFESSDWAMETTNDHSMKLFWNKSIEEFFKKYNIDCENEIL